MNDVVDIVYNLYKYGMTVQDISNVLGIDINLIQKYILDSKLKTTLALTNNETVNENILKNLISIDRTKRNSIIANLSDEGKELLFKEINDYFKNENLNVEDVMSVLWIIGELRTDKFNTILKNKSLSYNGNIKRMAISAMGKVLDPSFEPYLKQCCKDSKPQVRSYAIKAYSKLNSPDKNVFLEKLYLKENVDYNRRLLEKLIKEG